MCIHSTTKWGVGTKKSPFVEMTRTILFQNNVPKIFWSDAVLTATYLINRLPSSVLNFKSPLEIIFNRKLN